MKEVQLKKDQVERTFKTLDEEFIVYVEEAEQGNSVTYDSKANGMEKNSNKKKKNQIQETKRSEEESLSKRMKSFSS